jgi:hypothetical protein
MAKQQMQLFNLAAIKKAKYKDGEVVEEAEILIQPQSVLALDHQQAMIGFVMSNSDVLKGIPKSRLDIPCSPF